MERTCKKCGETKTIEEFDKTLDPSWRKQSNGIIHKASGMLGYNSTCYICRKKSNARKSLIATTRHFIYEIINYDGEKGCSKCQFMSFCNYKIRDLCHDRHLEINDSITKYIESIITEEQIDLKASMLLFNVKYDEFKFKTK
jgi:hypothetical protein